MEIEERNNSEERNNTTVNRNVTEWLARQFGTANHNISDLLRTQNATVYLLIWPIMEQRLFSGFMKASEIDSISEKLGDFFAELDTEEKARYFHNRYQDKKRYDLLTNSYKYESMERALSKNYADLTGAEKIIVMMTTVFRYRNNIFHGNKAIDDWNKYSKEIEYCIEFMMSVVDVYKKHFGEGS